MRKHVRIVVICLAGCVLTACVSKRQYVNREAELTQQLRDVEQQRDQSQTALRKLRQQFEALEAELTEQWQQERQQRHSAELRLQDAAQHYAQSQADLAALQSQYKAMQTNVKKNQTLLGLQRNMEQALKKELANQSVTIEALQGQLKVTLVDKILFRTGSAEIREQGRATLRQVAAAVRQEEDHLIRVEGHTDNVPIGPELQRTFPTNWELSTARATSVVRFLQEQGDIAPERLSASGYGSYRPVASNETEEERRQNRRIEILLVPASRRP